MPQFKQGDMFTAWNGVDYFCITTNAIVKRDGALVMGAGIAKVVRDKWPGVDQAIGTAILQQCSNGGIYGFLLGRKLCAFQVKRHFKDEASPELIQRSVQELTAHAQANPDKAYALNFPGIGNGKLKYDDVLPLLEPLPNNVTVWTF